jgi:ligand-binding sensor domain-containing protein
VATDGGLSRFDPAPGKRRFTNYAPSGPEDARHVNALIEDDDGSFLLATSAGLYRFRNQRDNSAFERIDLGPSPDSSAAVMVNGIARDARHALWLATNHGL